MKINEAAKLRILYFLAFSCTAAWQPIFADYLNSRGITDFRMGLILAVTPLLMFVVQPFYGMLADRYGYKKCLLLSALLASISFTLYLFDGGFIYLMVVTIAMSVFYNSTQPLLDSLSLTFIKRNPSFSYGSLRIAGAAGWAFTGIIVGYFIDKLSTQVIFASSAISMLLTFVFAFLLHFDKEKDASTEKLSISKDLKEILQNNRLLILLFSVFLVYAASSPIYYFYSIYLHPRWTRRFLSAADLDAVAQAIKAAEARTSAEIRVHLERRLPRRLLLGRAPDVITRARQVFQRLGMHRTAQRHGVLIYLAVEDHRFAVIGDEGIHGRVGDSHWHRVRDLMGDKLRANAPREAIERAIEELGQALAQHYPRRPDDLNELSDEVSVT